MAKQTVSVKDNCLLLYITELGNSRSYQDTVIFNLAHHLSIQHCSDCVYVDDFLER